jgi:hypothetical protein
VSDRSAEHKSQRHPQDIVKPGRGDRRINWDAIALVLASFAALDPHIGQQPSVEPGYVAIVAKCQKSG